MYGTFVFLRVCSRRYGIRSVSTILKRTCLTICRCRIRTRISIRRRRPSFDPSDEKNQRRRPRPDRSPDRRHPRSRSTYARNTHTLTRLTLSV